MAFSGELIRDNSKEDLQKDLPRENAKKAKTESEEEDVGPAGEGIEMSDMKDVELSGDADRVTMEKESEKDDNALIQKVEVNDEDVSVCIGIAVCPRCSVRNESGMSSVLRPST